MILCRSHEAWGALTPERVFYTPDRSRLLSRARGALGLWGDEEQVHVFREPVQWLRGAGDRLYVCAGEVLYRFAPDLDYQVVAVGGSFAPSGDSVMHVARDGKMEAVPMAGNYLTVNYGQVQGLRCVGRSVYTCVVELEGGARYNQVSGRRLPPNACSAPGWDFAGDIVTLLDSYDKALNHPTFRVPAASCAHFALFGQGEGDIRVTASADGVKTRFARHGGFAAGLVVELVGDALTVGEDE